MLWVFFKHISLNQRPWKKEYIRVWSYLEKKDSWILANGLFEQMLMSDLVSPTRTRRRGCVADCSEEKGSQVRKPLLSKSWTSVPVKQQLSPAKREVKSTLFCFQEEPGGRARAVHPSSGNKTRRSRDLLPAGRAEDAWCFTLGPLQGGNTLKAEPLRGKLPKAITV